MFHVVSAISSELGSLQGSTVGVGPIRAAAKASQVFGAQSPNFVVLVGTAGRYFRGPPVGSIIQSRKLGWRHGIEELGKGYVPLPPETLHSSSQLNDHVALPTADVLTLGAITTDPQLTAQYGEQWQVEHMEAYGVAHAASLYGIPFLAILGITNDVGPDAHKQWLANRDEVEAAVVAYTEDLLVRIQTSRDTPLP